MMDLIAARGDTIIRELEEFIPRQQYEEVDKTAARMMKDAPAA
jgi:hypothetical protein